MENKESKTVKFLRGRNMLTHDCTEFYFKGSFGEIKLNNLLEQYHEEMSVEPIERLKKLGERFDFNIQIMNNEYNIYCMSQDFHGTDVASVGGHQVLEDAVEDLLQQLENKGYDLKKLQK